MSVNVTAANTTLNGNTLASVGVFTLTQSQSNQIGSFWYDTLIPTTAFTLSWEMQWQPPYYTANPTNGRCGDGVCLVAQSSGLGAISTSAGMSLGYEGIPTSACVKFDVYLNPPDPSDNCTGLFLNGAPPVGGIDMNGASPVLSSGDVISGLAVYDGTNLTVTLTDGSNSNIQVYPLNLASVTGSSTCYIGFTGSTGAGYSTQVIENIVLTPAGVPTGSFSASPSNLNCSNIASGTTLSWTTTNASSVSIDHGIGTVATSGSIQVYPTGATTYTLTAVGPLGEATFPATVTVDPSVAFPSVDGMPVQWSGGQTYLAGPYLITCCGGGYEYNPAGYSAGYGYTVNGDVDYDNGQGYAVPSRGFRLFSGIVKPDALGQRFLAPGLRSNYPSAAACTTANAGQQNIFYHTGGEISLYLEDFPYWDNVLDSTMPVSFGVAGPGPVISFTQSSTGPVNAGTSVTLSWAVQYSAGQSIDNGIGAVSATGTTVVNPTVTTTYNLTAAGTGITQIASVTVYVYVPTAPANIDMVNACGAQISLVWEPGQYGTSQIVQRSTDNATWTTIATIATGVNSYIDTVTRSTQFFYQIINTDGYHPAISASYEASAIALPLAVTNLASTTSGMVVNLSWTPNDGSSYFVYRNGDLCNPLAFVGTTYADSGGLVSGDTYTYVVQSVNQCGETANSGSITATPYYNLNAYTQAPAGAGNWSN